MRDVIPWIVLLAIMVMFVLAANNLILAAYALSGIGA
jgi:hypothetical protein